MPRAWKHHLNLTDGTRVGYSLVERGDYYRVKFIGPEGRVELATGCRVEADAHRQAYDIISKTLRPPEPPKPPPAETAAGWDEVSASLAAAPGIRPETRNDYLDTIKVFRAMVPGSLGPGDVTPDVAKKFKRDYLTGTYTKSDKLGAKEYRRSPQTVASRLNKLSSLWQKHLVEELGVAASNPWAGVRPPPRETKAPTAPTAADVEELLAYLAGRYPGWGLPGLFVRVKEWTGSRLADLCRVRSDQLRDGRLHFSVEQTKTRAERVVALPADLAAELDAAKGPTYLWEAYAEGAARYRRSRNKGAPASFSPTTFYHAMANLFREFNESRPDKPRVKSHGLRRRAVTEMVVANNGSVAAAAQAIGMTRQTAEKHYLDARQAFDNEAAFKAREAYREKRGTESKRDDMVARDGRETGDETKNP